MSSADLARPLLPILALSLAACTHTIEQINLKDGSTLSGTRRLRQHSLTVIVPTDETATGPYTKLTTVDIRDGSQF